MEIGISHQYSPSFSSTLLDSIYRSIDAGDDDMAIYSTESTRTANKQSKTDEEMANFRRACMIEKWMEKKAFEKSAVRRNSDQFPRKSENSSWSSSDSAATGGGSFFSPSSEAESFPLPRPRPVRTGLGSDAKLGQNRRGGESDPKPKDESGGFLRTKSRALKIYGDLKKVKQPISPGGKLAGFLNSLFAGAAKSTKIGGGDYSTNASSTCSSASSFSRSCLSKTPSSRGKASSSSNGVKRSVRFSPVSVIVGGEDENSRNSHTHNKILHPPSKPGATTKSIRSVINEELMMVDKNRRGSSGRVVVAEEVITREYLLRNYHMNKKSHVQNQSFDDDYEEDDDDDAASYASSDLFELDNLSAIGMDHQRYREELPVYETTRLDRTNRHVANGGMVF